VNAVRRRKALTLDAVLAASSARRLAPCRAPITVFITPYKNVQYMQKVCPVTSDCRGLIALTLSPNAMNLWEILWWVLAIEGSTKTARR
jgi:hypothetical protein